MIKRIIKTPERGEGCLFADRDGVINVRRPGGYVTTWSDFHFRPGAIGALRRASEVMPVVIVSNQRCIALGIASIAEVAAVMDEMVLHFESAGVRIAAWYVCPHDTNDACFCRKPNHGMLLDAATTMGVDLSRSYMIGDSTSDIEAGKRAGCAASLLCDESDVRSLNDAIDHILERALQIAR